MFYLTPRQCEQVATHDTYLRVSLIFDYNGGGYLNFTAWFMKNVLFEHKKIEL
jgi:hypothetical protein